LPGSGDDVFITSGTTVIVDTTVNTLVTSVNVQSRAVLTCPRNAQLGPTPDLTELGLALSTLRFEGGGCFSCGHGTCTDDAEPFAGKFVLRLTSDAPPASAEENVRTLMVESSGALFLSGAPRVRPVTRLAEHAEAGQAILRVLNADVILSSKVTSTTHQPWRIGDRVVIAPTDWASDQTEYGTIVGLEVDAEGAGGDGVVLGFELGRSFGEHMFLTFVEESDNMRLPVDVRIHLRKEGLSKDGVYVKVEDEEGTILSVRTDPYWERCRSRYWNLLDLSTYITFERFSILETDLGPFEK
jgi:hypothetical protein